MPHPHTHRASKEGVNPLEGFTPTPVAEMTTLDRTTPDFEKLEEVCSVHSHPPPPPYSRQSTHTADSAPLPRPNSAHCFPLVMRTNRMGIR